MKLTSKVGFTLIELLISVVIIGILSAIGLGQFHTAQMRSRDAQRKENLSSVAKALEMYYNDYNRYPDSLIWGSAFVDDIIDGEAKTTYMKDLPNDPSTGLAYFYETDESGSYYKLYSYIENGEDRCFADGQCQDSYPSTDCGLDESAIGCRYCLPSPNASCSE